MSDHEFESADSGASLTTPLSAGSLRKGGFVLIKGFPCKVVELTTSKTGKHGHAKANITAIDIFTGKKYEDSCPTSHNIDVPNVTRVEYQLTNIEDDHVDLMTDTGDIIADVTIPKDSSGNDDEVGTQLREMFAAGQDIGVVVLMSMNQKKIVQVKELNN